MDTETDKKRHILLEGERNVGKSSLIRKILKENGVTEEQIDYICRVINSVSFSKNKGKVPDTIEGKIVQDADAIYSEEIDKAAAAYKEANGESAPWMPNQYFAALTNMRSVGVMGDERTYDYAIALRAVRTIDFMTAEAADIPFSVLQTVMSRIINEVRGVNRVLYDISSKPPGTIEFE